MSSQLRHKNQRHMIDNPTSEHEHEIDEAMVSHHKHVFHADRLQECVNEHVQITRRNKVEPLAPSRLFVIYDNVEAAEPGDVSHYSAVLDAPLYKLGIEQCNEAGYVKLKLLEILENSLKKEFNLTTEKDNISRDSTYSESEKESEDLNEVACGKRTGLEEKRKNNKFQVSAINSTSEQMLLNRGKHREPMKEDTRFKNQNHEMDFTNHSTTETNKSLKELNKDTIRTKKTVLNKNNSQEHYMGRTGTVEILQTDDTETSGYRSNSSSRLDGSSETDSDYGYATITESSTPKSLELSLHSNFSMSSAYLPENCFMSLQIPTMNDWDEGNDDVIKKYANNKKLYETVQFLMSTSFMTIFVDNLMIKFGESLGLSQDIVNRALTQGASVYCQSKHGHEFGCEVIPGIATPWPNVANLWIIRERQRIQNAEGNIIQWPTKNMVDKAVGFGCLLVPVGFRSKRGLNCGQKLQWKIMFPAAERYLDSCLAHSHVRYYLFTLVLNKVFLENETYKIGIDSSHIKNHLFWHCEDNYAKWPEDRLGESLRLFLRSFYTRMAHANIPNYFIENCNDFKSIPKPLLLKLQRKLANILESPVMHVLYALRRLAYKRKEFYPMFNIKKLYNILTCDNPIQLLNPNLRRMSHMPSSGSEENDANIDFWDRAKAKDRQYQWQKERHRQMQQRRKTLHQSKEHKSFKRSDNVFNPKLKLPRKLQSERRRLVLEFFIPHFIAMARASDRFDAVKQAILYLQQAHRLCLLLQEEPSGEITALDYREIIDEKLRDYQRKLVSPSASKQHKPRISVSDSNSLSENTKQRPKYSRLISQDSPGEPMGKSHSVSVEVHEHNVKSVPANNTDSESESKL